MTSFVAHRGIQLRRYQIEQVNHYYLHGFRIRVDVAAVSGGMTPEIFVYKRLPPDPETGTIVDEFQTIASFVDMADWPVGAPISNGEPFFRSSVVELDVRSEADYQYIWTIILQQANQLCWAMDKAEQLENAETSWVGIAPDENSDSIPVSDSYSESDLHQDPIQ